MEIDKPHDESGRQSLRLEVISINRTGPQKLEVLARDIAENKQGQEYDVMIEGIWTQGNISEHSILHLINPLYDSKTKKYSVDNSNGLLVTEPDNLLTCTLVASSLFCERKTWLNNVFLGQVGTNRAMLVGTLVHEVFQYGVKNRCADIDKLTKFLDEQLDDATVMLEIYSVELHLRDVRSEAIAYIKSVKEWIEKFMLAGPRQPLTNDSSVEVKVVGISDIEENVWSTKYGLKGKIDVTGAVRIYDKRTKTLKDKTLPLELKTGNPNLSQSHAAQVSLYSMMIEDRYLETNQGLVIYLKDRAAMHNVTLTHNIKRDLVQRRNQLNYHLKNFYYGPEMIDQTRMCKGCDRLTECILMSKLYDNDLDRYPGMKSLEREAMGHLDDKFEEFFKFYHEKLSRLMIKSESLDSNVSANGQRQTVKGSFWTYSSIEAERKGTGFGKLQAKTNPGSSVVIFTRHPDCRENLLTNGDVVDSVDQPTPKKLKINDYFKIKKSNDEGDRSRMKSFDTGFDFSRCRLAISLDSDNVDMDSKNSSTALAIGFMQDLKEDHFKVKIYDGSIDLFKPDLMYRVDKIEKRANLDIERLVLVRLLTRDDWRCDRIRQLLLDPKFTPTENINLNLFVLDAGFEEISDLEASMQKVAVDAISTDNYYIITEQIVPKKARLNKLVSVLAKVINSLDRSALIVAPTIDQLCDLMRILHRKTRFILIDDGKSTKARYTYASNLVKVPQGDNIDLVKKFDSYVRQHEIAPVVITTFAMAVGGLQFTRRTFDYCIAYDCDKVELLVSLSPMFCSDRYIIIDVRDEEATNCGNGETRERSATGVSGTDNTLSGSSNKQNLYNASRDTTLGEHLRALRPDQS